MEIAGTVYLPHPAGAERLENAVVGERFAEQRIQLSPVVSRARRAEFTLCSRPHGVYGGPTLISSIASSGVQPFHAAR